MKNKPYIVQGFLEALPGKENELEKTLISLIKPSKQESGCIDYDLFRSMDNPAVFMFYETWINQEAFAQHIAAPHIKAWLARKEELLAKPNEVSFWEILS